MANSYIFLFYLYITKILLLPLYQFCLTLRQNYVRLGLLVDVNEDLKPRPPHVKQSLLDEKGGLLTDGLAQCKELVLAPYEAKSMSLKEQRMLMALMRAYDEDFEAMAKDSKLNVHQHTEGELRRRVGLYRKLCDS